jgi:hypothetical protein
MKCLNVLITSVKASVIALFACITVGCGQNSELDLNDITLAPDLELLNWDFEPLLAGGQGSDLIIEMRNRGAIDARKFRVDAQALEVAYTSVNNEGHVWSWTAPRDQWTWAGRQDVQFLAALQFNTVRLPIQPTRSGRALLEITLDSREEIADPDRTDNTNIEACGVFGCFYTGKPFGDLIIISGGGDDLLGAPEATN